MLKTEGQLVALHRDDRHTADLLEEEDVRRNRSAGSEEVVVVLLHVGLDLSRRRVDVCLLSGEGELVEQIAIDVEQTRRVLAVMLPLRWAGSVRASRWGRRGCSGRWQGEKGRAEPPSRRGSGTKRACGSSEKIVREMRVL